MLMLLGSKDEKKLAFMENLWSDSKYSATPIRGQNGVGVDLDFVFKKGQTGGKPF